MKIIRVALKADYIFHNECSKDKVLPVRKANPAKQVDHITRHYLRSSPSWISTSNYSRRHRDNYDTLGKSWHVCLPYNWLCLDRRITNLEIKHSIENGRAYIWVKIFWRQWLRYHTCLLFETCLFWSFVVPNLVKNSIFNLILIKRTRMLWIGTAKEPSAQSICWQWGTTEFSNHSV